MKNNIKFLRVNILMKAMTSPEGADKAINKFGWAAIILASCLGLAAIIASLGITGVV